MSTHNMFLGRNTKNYPRIIIEYSSLTIQLPNDFNNNELRRLLLEAQEQFDLSTLFAQAGLSEYFGSIWLIVFLTKPSHKSQLHVFMSPNLQGWRDIDSGENPIGMTLYSVQYLTKFSLIYNWDITKNWLDFGDLDLIFKSENSR